MPWATDPWWERVHLAGGVLVRAVVPGDAEGVFAVHGDPRVYAFDPQERHVDVAQSRRFLTPMVDHWARHGFGYWAVLVPSSWWPEGVAGGQEGDGDRVHAGLGGAQHHVVAGRPVLNVYFRLAPEVQGRGVAGQVVDAVARMAAEVTPGVDVVVRTRPANVIARRVAERAGYVDEGLEPGTTDMQVLRLRQAPARSPASPGGTRP